MHNKANPQGIQKQIKLFSGPVFILILLTLGFNGILSTLSLEKLYVESLVSRYQVVGDSLRKKIELSIQFGKKIENFYGINGQKSSLKNLIWIVLI